MLVPRLKSDAEINLNLLAEPSSGCVQCNSGWGRKRSAKLILCLGFAEVGFPDFPTRSLRGRAQLSVGLQISLYISIYSQVARFNQGRSLLSNNSRSSWPLDSSRISFIEFIYAGVS